jgi:hypothetical protein
MNEYRIVSYSKVWDSTIVQAESFEEALKVFNGDIVRPMETEEIAHWSPEITKIEMHHRAKED